jgi:hypothetical protein
MEVHAHTHSERKRFTHYLWEFLMLFLAVFCGFLAENQREYMVEKKREKEYIISFIEDLKTDTAAIRRVLSDYKRRAERLDSLMLLLESKKIKGYENQLYYFSRVLQRSAVFRSNDRTISQLKNSGSFRLIRNKQAVDSIILYDKMLESYLGNQEGESEERKDLKPVLSKMFSPFVFDKMIEDGRIKRPIDNPPLSSYDPKLQQELAYSVHQLKGSLQILTSVLENLNAKAINIIAFLKKEYHLK